MADDPYIERSPGGSGEEELHTEPVTTYTSAGLGVLAASTKHYYNPQNPKTRKNLDIYAYLDRTLNAKHKPSKVSGKRWVSVQAYNRQIGNDPHVQNGGAMENVGLVISTVRKPQSGGPWDEVTHVIDTTIYPPTLTNPPPIPTVVVTGHLIELRYPVYGFLGSVYNWAIANGMFEMKFQLIFQSGHTRDITLKAPVGVMYRTLFNYDVSHNFLHRQRLKGCQFGLYGKGANYMYCEGAASGEAYFILQRYKPKCDLVNAPADPAGTLQEWGGGGWNYGGMDLWPIGQIPGFASCPLETEQTALGSGGLIHNSVHPDIWTTAAQEFHRIDVIAQENNFDYTGDIDGKDWAWFVANYNPSTFGFVGFSNSMDPDHNRYDITSMFTGSMPTSFDSVVSSIDQKAANQIFTYTVYYSENILPCGGGGTTDYVVCMLVGNPSYFETTAKDCAGGTIPATDLPGGANYNLGNVTFVADNSCCTDCLNFTLQAQAFDCSTSLSTDGFIYWDVIDPGPPLDNYSGTPFGSNSAYTVTVTDASGVAITGMGTTASTGGNATSGISCTFNTTSGTEHTFTMPSNDQVTPGMKIAGHTFYDAPTAGNVVTEVYVGGAVLGMLSPGNTVGPLAGDLNDDATQWSTVDRWDIPVYSQAAGAVSCTFSVGFKGIRGNLEPNDLTNPTYYLCVTDGNSVLAAGCQICVPFQINAGAVLTGCTDSSSLNYDSTATIDDGSCLFCRIIDGLLYSPSTGATTDMFDSHTVISFQSATAASSTTHNSDGTLDVSASSIAAIVGYLDADANSTWQIKLYLVSNFGDDYSTGTLVSTFNSGTFASGIPPASNTFTSLAYGYYAVTWQYIDSNTVHNAELCLSQAWGTVRAEVCDDSNSSSYNVAPTDPNLRDDQSAALCTSPVACCVLDPIIEDTTDPCNPFLVTEIVCDPARIVNVGWEFDDGSGSIIIASYTMGSVGPPTTMYCALGNNPGNGSLFMVYGMGTYTVSITATHTASGDICTESESDSFTPPVTDCDDSTANNYNASSICPCGSCCTYDSWDCDSGICLNTPVNDSMLIVYPTFNDCDTYCVPPDVYGCTDSCATPSTYNPLATIDDGSCEYSGCIYPPATNYNHNCCLGVVPPGPITVSDPGCCLTPCTSNSNTVIYGISPSTGTCTVFNADGELHASVTLFTGATTWTWEIYDATGTILVFTDPVTYTGSTQSNTYNLLMYGIYTIVITDNLGCTRTDTITIPSDAPAVGCTDPNALNYDPAAVCDCCCQIQGCMDPNATNYNPNATIPGQCDYILPPPSPCIPQTLDDNISLVQACLSLKGTSWLHDYKLGRTVDCSLLNKWKLILIEYLLKEDDLSCLFNCADIGTPAASTIQDCHALWVTGGPSTGPLHDIAHQGASVVNSGEGTTITTYDNFPTGWFGFDSTLSPTSNKTFIGDVVKFDLAVGHPLALWLNGTIWTLTAQASTAPNPQGLHEGCNLNKIGHYTQCLDYRLVSITETINYYDKFINFVNKCCQDCKISILQQTNGREVEYRK